MSASGTLTAFDVSKPEKAKVLGAPTGLVGDTRLVGIYFRVQNKRLYGVGNAGGIYAIGINGSRESATKVSQLTVAVSGTSFGVADSRQSTFCASQQMIGIPMMRT